jgi:hypothetical protein
MLQTLQYKIKPSVLKIFLCSFTYVCKRLLISVFTSGILKLRTNNKKKSLDTKTGIVLHVKNIRTNAPEC